MIIPIKNPPVVNSTTDVVNSPQKPTSPKNTPMEDLVHTRSSCRRAISYLSHQVLETLTNAFLNSNSLESEMIDTHKKAARVINDSIGELHQRILRIIDVEEEKERRG